MLIYPRSPFRTSNWGLCGFGFLYIPCLAHRHLLRRSLLGDAPIPSRNYLPTRSGRVPKRLHVEAEPILERKADRRTETPEALEHHRKLYQTAYLSSPCRSYHLLLLVLVLGV